MMLLSSGSDIAQFITVLVIFVLVLAVTAIVTKWLANYQKAQNASRNLEVLETSRLANNKWIQLVRVGNTIKVVALGKDTVTYLGDVDPETIKEGQPVAVSVPFRSFFDKALNIKPSDDSKEENNQ